MRDTFHKQFAPYEMRAAIKLPLTLRREKGGYMKQRTLTTSVMLSLLLMLTAVTVSAQSGHSGVIDIPFNFIIGQKILPSGEYTVGVRSVASNTVWLVQSRDARAGAFFLTIPVQASETQEKTKLVFHKYGDQYFLSQIWIPGSSSGRELSMPRMERELAKDIAERRTVSLTARRR
jgi:hypothetical protein